jgi:hypothetical protein
MIKLLPIKAEEERASAKPIRVLGFSILYKRKKKGIQISPMGFQRGERERGEERETDNCIGKTTCTFIYPLFSFSPFLLLSSLSVVTMAAVAATAALAGSAVVEDVQGYHVLPVAVNGKHKSLSRPFLCALCASLSGREGKARGGCEECGFNAV